MGAETLIWFPAVGWGREGGREESREEGKGRRGKRNTRPTQTTGKREICRSIGAASDVAVT